ncbi:MAG TPA: T9SS type A sorting domain-containing protein [Flavobacterium sp.]|uniref:T9SS type A sorting domain-containing protein n=1 Tax=Flavobacterium sp. TaxID=239 RepID=UPI002ED681BB
MKKKLLFIICCLIGMAGFSQEKNVNYVNRINKRLYDIGDSQSRPESLERLQACADQGDANCLNLLGLLYREGLGVQKSEDKAFELIMKAAQKEFPAAEFNIGRFYMIGLGCDIDFDQATHWLTIAADHANERAAYALGYMYFKGFGVQQDYKKAISWFELSPWSMAKHHLGLCYYFGYGVEKDEDKAILYFSQSQTTNSNMFLKHIAENVKESVDAGLAKEISETETKTNTAIAKEAIDKTTEKSDDTAPAVSKKELKPKYFNGKWKGKLVELDWSKKEIVRILPLSCEFTTENNNVHYKWNLNNQTAESTAVLEDNALYFDKLNMTFDMPYSENPNSNTQVTQLLSAQMEFKTVNKKVYLTGNLQTFTDEWKESAPPMHIILKQTEEGDEDLTEEELLALSDQKEHFITLYPNPFENDVLIAYELENAAVVNVGVYDLSGNAAAITLEQDASQTQGKHKYTVNGSSLLPGMYIVRVGVNNEMHSRILIKK